MESIALSINGKRVTCRAGDTLLSAAEKNGIFIPTLCHHPDLKPYGACRMCLVEDVKSGRLMAACVTPAAKDMAVQTDTERIVNHRRNIVRLMIAEHPESCLVCAKGNRCELRGLAARLGVAETKLYPMSNYKPYEELNPFIVRDLSKCILCGKCIRADHELVVTGAIDYNDRGFSSRPATLMEKPLEESTCTFCGTCVSVCPTGALSPRPVGYVGTPEKEHDSVCGFCGAGCSLTMGLNAGRVVEVNPSKMQGSVNGATLCVRGHFAHDYLNCGDRLHTPMIRGTNENGETVFDPADWDTAVARTAEMMADIKRNYGPGSVAFIGSPRCTIEENYLFQKIARALFETNNVTTTASVNGQAVIRRIEEKSMGTARIAPLSALEQAGAIVAVNADPDHSVPVAGYYAKRAARAGIPLITVSAGRTGLVPFSRAWVRADSGPDPEARIPALIWAIGEKMAERGGQDTDFIQQRTTGWEAWKSAAASFSSGQPLSETEQKAVNLAAELLAGRKVAFLLGGDLLERDHGERTADAVFDLALVTGSIGAQNAGFFIAAPESNTMGALDMGMAPDLLPGRLALSDETARKKLERIWKSRLSPDPGLNLVDIIEAAETGHIKGLYIMGENLLRALPDAARVEAALKKLDFIVVQDIVDTRTARLANVVLPGAASAEKGGAFTNMEGRIQAFGQAADPPGQAMSDWQILSLLARKMGYPEQYGTLEKIRQEIRKAVPMYGELGSQRQAWVKNAETETPFSGNGSRFAFHDRQTDRAAAAAHEAGTFTALLGPLRWHLGDGSRTERSERIASWMRDSHARLNPDDMAALGLSDKDRTRIFSGSGEIERTCVSDRGIPPGQVFVPLGFYGNDAVRLADLESLRAAAPGWRTRRVQIQKI